MGSEQRRILLILVLVKATVITGLYGAFLIVEHFG